MLYVLSHMLTRANTDTHAFTAPSYTQRHIHAHTHPRAHTDTRNTNTHTQTHATQTHTHKHTTACTQVTQADTHVFTDLTKLAASKSKRAANDMIMSPTPWSQCALESD